MGSAFETSYGLTYMFKAYSPHPWSPNQAPNVRAQREHPLETPFMPDTAPRAFAGRKTRSASMEKKMLLRPHLTSPRSTIY